MKRMTDEETLKIFLKEMKFYEYTCLLYEDEENKFSNAKVVKYRIPTTFIPNYKMKFVEAEICSHIIHFNSQGLNPIPVKFLSSNYSESTIRRHLKILKEKGVIFREGAVWKYNAEKFTKEEIEICSYYKLSKFNKKRHYYLV